MFFEICVTLWGISNKRPLNALRRSIACIISLRLFSCQNKYLFSKFGITNLLEKRFHVKTDKNHNRASVSIWKLRMRHSTVTWINRSTQIIRIFTQLLFMWKNLLSMFPSSSRWNDYDATFHYTHWYNYLDDVFVVENFYGTILLCVCLFGLTIVLSMCRVRQHCCHTIWSRINHSHRFDLIMNMTHDAQMVTPELDLFFLVKRFLGHATVIPTTLHIDRFLLAGCDANALTSITNRSITIIHDFTNCLCGTINSCVMILFWNDKISEARIIGLMYDARVLQIHSSNKYSTQCHGSCLQMVWNIVIRQSKILLAFKIVLITCVTMVKHFF